MIFRSVIALSFILYQESSGLDNFAVKLIDTLKATNFFDTCTLIPFVSNDTIQIWKELSRVASEIESQWWIPQPTTNEDYYLKNQDFRKIFFLSLNSIIQVPPFVIDDFFDNDLRCKVAILLDKENIVHTRHSILLRRDFDLHMQFGPIDNVERLPVAPILEGTCTRSKIYFVLTISILVAPDSKYPQYKLSCNSHNGHIVWYQGRDPPTEICREFDALRHDKSPLRIFVLSGAVSAVLHYWLWFYALLSHVNLRFVLVPYTNYEQAKDIEVCDAF